MSCVKRANWLGGGLVDIPALASSAFWTTEAPVWAKLESDKLPDSSSHPRDVNDHISLIQ